MIRLLAVAVCTILALSPSVCLGWNKSGVTYTTDGSYSDVSSAVADASTGDAVLIPSGSFSWGSSTLTITKGISVLGAGKISTTVTTNGDIRYDPDSATIAADDQFQLASFKLVSGQLFLDCDDNTDAIENILVHQMEFNDTSSPAIETSGQTWGVIGNCGFVNIDNRLLHPRGNDTITEWKNHYTTIGFGNQYNLYFENNTIRWTGTHSSTDPGMIMGGHCNKVVVRYNTWDFSNVNVGGSWNELWDTHGWQYWEDCSDSCICGGMLNEYYGNAISGGDLDVWLFHRSANGMFHNNTFSGTGAPSWKMQLYEWACEEHVNAATPCCGGVDYTSKAVDGFTTEIEETYSWNNTENGSRTAPTATGWHSIGDPSGCGLTEDVHYWSWDDNCTDSNCASGIGRGTSAPTGNCTTGVAYWVASTATTTTDSSIVQNGTLWKCTSTNVWEEWYTPYTYPHPLIGGEATPSSPPPPTPPPGRVNMPANAVGRGTGSPADSPGKLQ